MVSHFGESVQAYRISQESIDVELGNDLDHLTSSVNAAMKNNACNGKVVCILFIVKN